MLVLTGRSLGLRSEQFEADDGQAVTFHRMTVVRGDGSTVVVKVPRRVFVAVGPIVERLRTFGQPVQVECDPDVAYENGRSVGVLSARAIQLITEDGELLADSVSTVPA